MIQNVRSPSISLMDGKDICWRVVFLLRSPSRQNIYIYVYIYICVYLCACVVYYSEMSSKAPALFLSAFIANRDVLPVFNENESRTIRPSLPLPPPYLAVDRSMDDFSFFACMCVILLSPKHQRSHRAEERLDPRPKERNSLLLASQHG